ncbi:TIM barrel protein [Halomonas shantousis]
MPWLVAAGADGVEIRRELLPEGFVDFAALGKDCARHNLAVVYSAADALWHNDACLPDVTTRLNEAAALGAVAVKFSLGQYTTGPETAWSRLRKLLLASHTPVVMVENDQTRDGGTPEPLSAFLADAERAECPLFMTFDIGNWRWTDSDVDDAARRLGRHVRYVHCKGIEARQGQLHACIPSENELDAWRALMARFPAGVPRAIEYPLQAPDSAALTRRELDRLATL